MDHLVQSPTLPLTGCVTLGLSYSISSVNGDNISSAWHCWGIYELIVIINIYLLLSIYLLKHTVCFKKMMEAPHLRKMQSSCHDMDIQTRALRTLRNTCFSLKGQRVYFYQTVAPIERHKPQVTRSSTEKSLEFSQ